MARGDFLEKNGSAVITDGLTYVGAGGIDVTILPFVKGSTTVIGSDGKIDVAGFGIWRGTTAIINTTGTVNVGQGGLNKGTTRLIETTGDIATGAVGGQLVCAVFSRTFSGTVTPAAAIPLMGGSTVTKFVLPRPGSLIGLTVYNSTITVHGYCTITAYVGGTASSTAKIGMTHTINTHGGTVTQAKNLRTIAAGNFVSVYLKCATATPSTVVATAWFEC